LAIHLPDEIEKKIGKKTLDVKFVELIDYKQPSESTTIILFKS
jgi:hypothetical protein